MKHLPIIIVGKGVLTPTLTSLPPPPYFMKTALYCLPSLFQILSNTLNPLSPPNPTPTALSVVLFLWLNG